MHSYLHLATGGPVCRANLDRRFLSIWHRCRR